MGTEGRLTIGKDKFDIYSFYIYVYESGEVEMEAYGLGTSYYIWGMLKNGNITIH